MFGGWEGLVGGVGEGESRWEGSGDRRVSERVGKGNREG